MGRKGRRRKEDDFKDYALRLRSSVRGLSRRRMGFRERLEAFVEKEVIERFEACWDCEEGE